jgi:hypothetical protein
VSTKNIYFPKERSRKMVVKYIGPYKIMKDFGNNSYCIELPARLAQCGIHDVFYSKLLRVHVPNDNCLFPGRLETQIDDFGHNASGEWVIDCITSHVGSGSGRTATFEAIWRASDRTWAGYNHIKHVLGLLDYLELHGASSITTLQPGTEQPPDDPQVFAGATSYADEELVYHKHEQCPAASTRLSSFSSVLHISDMSADTSAPVAGGPPGDPTFVGSLSELAVVRDSEDLL